MPKNTMETITGVMIDPVNANVGDINLEDIAHALSRLNRYCGHIRPPYYTVAEHSWRVRYAARKSPYYFRRDVQRLALMHDATEAYLNDLVRPLKPRVQGYKEIEDRLEEVIALRFDLNLRLMPLVKEIDHNIILNERAQVKPYYAGNDGVWNSDVRWAQPEPTNWLARRTGIRLGKARYGWHPNVAKRRFLAAAAELGIE